MALHQSALRGWHRSQLTERPRGSARARHHVRDVRLIKRAIPRGDRASGAPRRTKCHRRKTLDLLPATTTRAETRAGDLPRTLDWPGVWIGQGARHPSAWSDVDQAGAEAWQTLSASRALLRNAHLRNAHQGTFTAGIARVGCGAKRDCFGHTNADSATKATIRNASPRIARKTALTPAVDTLEQISSPDHAIFGDHCMSSVGAGRASTVTAAVRNSPRSAPMESLLWLNGGELTPSPIARSLVAPRQPRSRPCPAVTSSDRGGPVGWTSRRHLFPRDTPKKPSIGGPD